MEKDFEERINCPQTRDIQACILGMLKDIDRVCREHNLRYYIIAGTMLGAVSHQGFVPWDDDADIALPRPDYEVLLEHANEWLSRDYELISHDKDSLYPYNFARIQDKRTTYIFRRFNYLGGLPVDIFPIDGMVEDGLRRKWHYFKYYWNTRLLYFRMTDPYKHGRGIRSLFVLFMHRAFSAKRLHKRLAAIQKEYDFDTSALVADHDNRPFRGILPKEVYGTPTPIMFEGVQLMGVEKPDEYLSYCYGNYMELPKQMPPQNFRYINLNLPYKDYHG